MLPTEAELRILEVLWTRGSATVREVHETLEPDTGTGYTTTLKLLQIMLAKGLVERRAEGRAHVYKPRSQRGAMERQLIADLARKAFGGSTRRLALRALAEEMAGEDELDRIAALLDRLEAEDNTG